ncbi:uncharacterized protein EI90DRAFT_3012987 [Cantharellus anzutake]|uniref:uncharacterized protein n=1 Tax=Cantharellus anzutake TaxID=1750568 RepID=UPI0019060C37|nr:uncharacterized protein EI90DRAFT_3012987 [Cantharellus anzutake]KAF8338847.1 hypothetical protein EI90DRAFT_3012987 [Cantharellus anzutake]
MYPTSCSEGTIRRKYTLALPLDPGGRFDLRLSYSTVQGSASVVPNTPFSLPNSLHSQLLGHLGNTSADEAIGTSFFDLINHSPVRLVLNTRTPLRQPKASNPTLNITTTVRPSIKHTNVARRATWPTGIQVFEDFASASNLMTHRFHSQDAHTPDNEPQVPPPGFHYPAWLALCGGHEHVLEPDWALKTVVEAPIEALFPNMPVGMINEYRWQYFHARVCLICQGIRRRAWDERRRRGKPKYARDTDASS